MKRGTLLLFFIATILIITFPFIALPTESSLAFINLLGRFHPLILHFPIVLFILVLAIELKDLFNIRPDLQLPDDLYRLLLTAAVGTILITTILGFLLYRSGEYQGTVIRDHLVGGVMLSLTSFLSLALYTSKELSKKKEFKIFYKGLIILSGIILFYTSHLGASITHGADFLTVHMIGTGKDNASILEAKKPEELFVYKDIIESFLDKRCYSCHNEYKSKGGLIMNNWIDLNKGGKSKKTIVVAGQPEKSELYHRIMLPDDDDDHMPPAEKPGLTQDEISILKWWIQQGADQEMILGQGPTDPNLQMTITNYLPVLYKNSKLRERQERETDKLSKELFAFGDKLGLVIEPDKSSESGNFAISMKMPPVAIDDQTIKSLLEYQELFSKISLPSSDITSDGLYDIRRMKNLESLYIPKTKIDGSGLIHLKKLQKLEVINLSHTNLTNEGLLDLLHLTTLKACYLFNTPISTDVLDAIKKNRPDLKLLMEEGPLY